MAYPYAKEFITDAKGHIVKVVIDWEEYLTLIEALEDEGLLRAMKEAKNEIPLSLDQALRELEKE
ncbi:MAG: hypothetical protein AB1656_05925 [Candidatus Omnitrophota bacterium]